MIQETQSQFISRKRKEIEKSLSDFLKMNNHPLTAKEIIGLVYEDAKDEDDFESYVMALMNDNPTSCEDAQEIAMELFNYFPRMSLKGKSFAEKLPFEKLKKMEKNFQDFINGGEGGSYSLNENDFDKDINLPSPYFTKPNIKILDNLNKDDLYYDAMDSMQAGNSNKAIYLLEQALKIDTHYVQTHHGLSAIYHEIGDMKI